jgi:hypothetical protein
MSTVVATHTAIRCEQLEHRHRTDIPVLRGLSAVGQQLPALLIGDEEVVHGEPLKLAGRNDPALPGHGAAQAIKGWRRPAGLQRRSSIEGPLVIHQPKREPYTNRPY